MNLTVLQSSLYQNLHLTLGTSRHSLVSKTKIPLFQILCEDLFLTSSKHPQEFYLIFSKRLQVIHFLLQETHATSCCSHLIKKIYAFILPLKLTTFIRDFLAFKGSLTIEMVQSLYQLAQDVKRVETKTLWNALPPDQQEFLHRLSPWTEDPQVLQEPLYYQWLGDGKIERAQPHHETITDFGGGRLFRVQPPSEQEEHYLFPLTRYPGFQLVKGTYALNQQTCERFFTRDYVLKSEAIGRMQEVFDVPTLVQELKKDSKSFSLLMHQFLELFSCYQAGLCSVFQLPVCLPVAIGARGEWAIWPQTTQQPLKEVSFSPSIVEDLHHFFHVEKLWNIHLFSQEGLESVWSVGEGRVMLHDVFSLPTFLKQNLEEQHEDLLGRLNLDRVSQEQWNNLEKGSRQEQEIMAARLQKLQILLNKKAFSLQDFVALDSQALWMVRLIRLLDLESAAKYPVNFPDVCTAAEQMLALLQPTNNAVYTYEQALQEPGSQLTNQLLNSKKFLRTHLLLFLIENMKKKESSKEWMNLLLQLAQENCEAIAQHLQAKFSLTWLEEGIQEHFMLLFGDEFLEELNCVLQQPLEDQQELYDRLLLLRGAFECSSDDLKEINHTLHSVLHDAMIKKYAKLLLEHAPKQIRGSLVP